MVLETDKGRIPDLVPLRHGRMAQSPFTFYRGSAFTMAQDLAGTPSSGLRVQCGGDSHLVNFRGLATAERQVIFALNDLDETLPAPWEWDLKRLAASIVVACRDNGLSESVAKDAVLGCVRSYRERMAEFSEMKVLDLWYFSIEANMLIAGIKDADIRRLAIKGLAKARESATSEGLFPKLVDAGRERSTSKTSFRPSSTGKVTPPARSTGKSSRGFDQYLETLTPAHRMLLDRYEMVDAALKVVGVGSVGTACWMILLTARKAGDPLILQVKEARASVLEGFAGKSVYPNHGQRVVNGLRLMQPSSDIFLGWTEGRKGRHFYLRQLRDVKIKFAVETFGAAEMSLFTEWCGYSLALSMPLRYASVDQWLPGEERHVDKAVAAFAVTYADQNESDHGALTRAIHNGTVKAVIEEAK